MGLVDGVGWFFCDSSSVFVFKGVGEADEIGFIQGCCAELLCLGASQGCLDCGASLCGAQRDFRVKLAGADCWLCVDVKNVLVGVVLVSNTQSIGIKVLN